MTVRELAASMGVHCPARPHDDVGIERGVAWTRAEAGRGDVLFAAAPELDADVPAALARGAWCVVHSSFAGESPHVLRVEDRLSAFRAFAAFMRSRFPFPVVAIGGSNGKTTTKDLVAWLLAHGGRTVTATPGTNNGWIGTALTMLHPDHRAPPPFALVMEIGIDEPGAMKEHVALARPDVAVLTALGPEHLAGLGTHEDAIREELVLFEGAKRRVWLADDPALAARLEGVREDDLVVHHVDRPVRAKRTLGYAWKAGTFTLAWDGRSIDVATHLPGAHNARNAALAFGVAWLLGRSPDEVAPALASFRPPPQRCAVRRLPGGCTLVDDTYNASPSSMHAALDVIEGFDPRRPRILVLGDMLDLGDASAALHDELVPRIRAMGATVRLFGDHMSRLAPFLDGAVCGELGDLDFDDAVVLVKGSRGMKLEKVVAEIERRAHRLRVGIAGPDAEALARTLRTKDVVVRALTIEDLEKPEMAARSFDVGIVERFVPAGADPERELAAIAQLFVHLTRGGVAVFGSEDEAMDLLAGVVPAHAKTTRAHDRAQISRVVDEAIEHRKRRSV